jgi:ABC-type sugar transport system ATPase subunit
MESNTEQQIEAMELSAEIIRADGTVERLGTVAAFYRDPQRQGQATEAGLGKITICE